MKKSLFCLVTVSLMIVFILPVCADEVETTEREIKKEIRYEEMEKAAADLGYSPEDLDAMLDPGRILTWLIANMGRLISEKSGILFSIAVSAVLVVILSRLAPSRQNGTVMTAVGIASVCALSASLFSGVLVSARTLVDSFSLIGGFTDSLVTVLAGSLAVSGFGETAASSVAVFTAESGVFGTIVRDFTVPAIGLYLSLGVSGGLTGYEGLSKLSAAVRNVTAAILIFLTALFTGVFSLRLSASTAADSVFRRAVTLGASSCIPVVGPYVSGGLEAVISCANAVRLTGGVFGIGVLASVLLPALLDPVITLAILSVGSAAFAPAKIGAVNVFFAVTKDALKILIGLMVAYTVILFAGIGLMMGAGL